MVSKTLLNAVIEIAERLMDLYPMFPKEEKRRLGAQEARLIVEEICEISSIKVRLLGKEKCTQAQWERMQQVVCERIERKQPLSRIFGKKFFWKSNFYLNKWTLDPRPETEGIIELALSFFDCNNFPRKIIDFGTGSGCLILSLLQEFPQAVGLGIDCEPRVFEVARKSAKDLGLEKRIKWKSGWWGKGIQGKFDCMVSNPPYICESELKILPEEVSKWDPIRALDGGENGIEAYKALIPFFAQNLTTQGVGIVEIGAEQAEKISCFASSYFSCVKIYKDLSGRDRYIRVSFEKYKKANKS